MGSLLAMTGIVPHFETMIRLKPAFESRQPSLGFDGEGIG